MIAATAAAQDFGTRRGASGDGFPHSDRNPLDGAWEREDSLLSFGCGMQSPLHSNAHRITSQIEPHNGTHLPPRDTIRSIIVFTQFAGDRFPDEYWEPGKLPLWSQRFADTLRDYFTAMSNGNLHMLFEVHRAPIVLPRTESDYLMQNKRYGDASKDIIMTLDSVYDFARFDRWNSQDRPYRIQKGPDGRVDLLVVVYRRSGWGGVLPFSGVSDLGFEGYVFVDSMRQYFYGGDGRFSDAASSGVTICRHAPWDVVTDYSFALPVAAHEIMHKIYGEGHPAKLYGGIGLLGATGGGLGCGSFERQMLGWMNFREIEYGRDTMLVLRDCLTRNDAILIPMPQRQNLFYSVEYRSRKSRFDTAPTAGVYITRIDNSGNSNQREVIVQSADGKWRWSYDSTVRRPVKMMPDLLAGLNKLQPIPIDGRNYYAQGWWGDSTDAFTPANRSFAWWRNPSPDCIMGNDTIRTQMTCTVIAMTDSSATVRLSYSPPSILTVDDPRTSSFNLGQNFPNPVHGGDVTTISFNVARRSLVRIGVYDLHGRVVREITEAIFEEGRNLISFGSSGLAAGTYSIVMQTNTGTRRRMFSVIR